MILTDEQKAMLDGKYGEGAAYAMKIQVGIGECFDAERMVPSKRAHVAPSKQAGDLWFADQLVKAGPDGQPRLLHRSLHRRLRPSGGPRGHRPHAAHGQCLPRARRGAEL